MNVKVKICGMREAENILDVGAVRPDYMGFIFHPQSPRCVPTDFRIPISLDSSIKRVGVFVNEKVDLILSLIKRHSLDFVQLHGNESVEICDELRLQGIGVIKVFSIDEGFDFGSIESYKTVVDFFLFDTKGKYYGGNGIAFNWNVLNRYDQEIPFFLSGGISVVNIQNVEQLAMMNMHAIDVNSGVEIKPGVKDVESVKEVMKNLK